MRATSFLLGTSWAFLLIGSYIIFQFISTFSFTYAIVISALFFIFVLFIILILGHLNRSLQHQISIEKKLDSLLHH